MSEIIFKTNRIVVEYDFEGLVIIGAVNRDTGKELSRSKLVNYCKAENLTIVNEHSKTLMECTAEDLPNFEGYVLTYANGLKIKIKELTYVKLHSLLTNTTISKLWELCLTNQLSTLDNYLKDEHIPLEFKNFLTENINQLNLNFNNVKQQAEMIFYNRPITTNRKTIAAYFLQEENKSFSGICFSLLDGKNITKLIWQLIKP